MELGEGGNCGRKGMTLTPYLATQHWGQTAWQRRTTIDGRLAAEGQKRLRERVEEEEAGGQERACRAEAGAAKDEVGG